MSMPEPMSDERLKEFEDRPLWKQTETAEVHETCQWIRRLRWENGLLDGETRRLLKKLKGHEATMRKVREMMKHQRELNAEQMNETIEPSPEEEILRASLEKL